MTNKRRAFDIGLLIQWEFQFFKYFSLYRDEKDFAISLNSLISDEQFQLISTFMSEAIEFSSPEVVELFRLGDKFLASGQTREKIFSLFTKHLPSEKVSIGELLGLNLWNEFKNHLKHNWAIEIDKYLIKLEGLKVNPDKKEETFIVLKNLAKNYEVLYIRDIPLCLNNLKAIHSDLTEFHIERCPFNFEEQLDLSQLTRLTHFTCSNCFADRHLLFTLETLTSSLEYLDISDNLLNLIDHSPLITWIEKQKSLKHLNLSGNNLNIKSAPFLFNVLFNLPSLEVLNLANNYLLSEFLKQLSSFPGSLNWKSLIINDSDVSLWKTDLFPGCFPKLKQLEYLDMSDTLDKDIEQEFSPSLWKGISELTNLKKFVFNSIGNRDHSSEIKKIYKQNPNLVLCLKWYTIKSFEDWELSTSHQKSEIEELINNENIENISQSIYRYIEFYLDSSNNKPSQIENLINKFKGAEDVKVYIIDCSTFVWKKRKEDIFSTSIELYILYETVRDLKNIIFCCRNYFKSLYVHLRPLKDAGVQWYEFLFKTKNSPFWESVEELKLYECDFTTIFKIMSEINLPNLKRLNLKNFKSVHKVDEFICSRIKIHSLQFLSMSFDMEATNRKSLRALLKCFPHLTECKMHVIRSDFSDLPLTSLPKGLRSLNAFTIGGIEYSDLLNLSTTFPLLTKLKVENDSKKFPNLRLNETVNFPNLTELIIVRAALEQATFVLPELRRLTIFHTSDLSFKHLREIKKLKYIHLNWAMEGFTQKLIDSNFLLSFSNLNEFQSCDKHFGDEFSYDSVPDVISKSLIYFNVNDCEKTDYYCKNENAKQLQEKRIPFLCKYGGRHIEWPHTHDEGW